MTTCIVRPANMVLTTLSPWGPKGGMLERKPQVQLPVGPAESGGQAGFTLIETVCVLAIFAMLAAVALPAFLKGTTRSRLEGYALQAATLLNADHDAAQRNGRDVATEVDAP